MNQFSARIFKIGINPYVIPPVRVLNYLFKQCGKEKGPIPVTVTLNTIRFPQNLVRYAGRWRLYLNNPMRQALQKDVGDTISAVIDFDPEPRTNPMHPGLKLALQNNPEAQKVFDTLIPSYQKEIIRYINNLKTPATVEKNIAKAIQHLLGKERFVGRDGVVIKDLPTK
ncbi:MAG: YdeI/OmpD-associated family protein [Bacteroidota bacterium]